MKKINESFVCQGCGFQVPKSNTSCRNHCPKCFLSLHLDENIPGDRSSKCCGKMYPTEYEISNGVTKITFVCEKCKKIHKNKSSSDDDLVNLDRFILEYKKFV